MNAWRILPLGVLTLAMLLRGAAQQPTPHTTYPEHGPRIVSLSPAITRAVADFGLDRNLVGCTPWCRAAPDGTPVVGDLHDINYEALVRLEPTHVFLQPGRRRTPERLRELAARSDWILRAWSLDGIEDVVTLVEDLPEALFPAADPVSTSARAEATRRADELGAALRGMIEPEPGIPRGRLLIVAPGPAWWAFGRGTYLADLAAARGWASAVPERGWVELSQEDLVRLDPDAVLLVRMADGDRAALEPAAVRLRGLGLDAAEAGRVGRLAHAEAGLPSTSLIEIAERLGAELEDLAADEVARD